MNKREYLAFLKKHTKFRSSLMTWEQYKERKRTLKEDVKNFKGEKE
jgi:hypothetical protein